MPIAPIYLASRGLTGQKDPSKLKTGDLVIARNLDWAEGGLLQKEGGWARINTAALAGGVLAGWDWFPTPAIQRRVVALTDGSLRKDTMLGTYATTLKTGLTVGTQAFQFVEGGSEAAGNNKKLFVFNGADPVQVLAADGATTTNLATPPADWAGTNQPTFGFIYANSLCGGGNANFQHQLYASTFDTNDGDGGHEDFDPDNSSDKDFTVLVYPGEGQRLVAGLSAFSAGFLWKHPVGLYRIVFQPATTSDTIDRFYVVPVSRQYGAAPTPHAVCQIDESVVAFVSNTGSIILMQESSGTLTGVTLTDLSKVLNLRSIIRDNFNLQRLHATQVRWYDEKKQLHATYAAKGSLLQDRRLVVDFNEERTRVSISSLGEARALWMEQDEDAIPRPRAGDSDGFTWRLDQTARNVNGAAYELTAQTAPTDFSDVNKGYAGRKLFTFLHGEFLATGDYDVDVEIFVDGQSLGSVPLNQQGSGLAATLPFTLPITLGASDLVRRTRDIGGEGYYFSAKVTEAGVNKNPRLARLWAEFEMTGMTP